ncbi:MAG TPA: TraB/GumN family protein, partial [Chitinophagaceae bacterium]|nr:TraB/GumN family protein [Chitinophagaceae bacterium]
MNRFLALSLLIVLCCMASLPGAAQAKKYPPTLLWRITGKSMSKPSYLFGTMHVTDRRVFYFGDSLYSSLEKADGYAMEVNPDTAVAALVRSILAKDTSGLLKDAMDNAAFSKMAKRLETELGVPANRITKKQLWLYSFKGGRDKKDDEMDSPVDTYLYNIAKRQGKWVGGI